MKIYVQKFPEVFATSASLAASASTSGSMVCDGYARIIGGIISSASLKAGSGLRIWQSFNDGLDWDYFTDYVLSACSGSAFSIEIIGNAVKVGICTDGTGAPILRTHWQLRPI